MQRVLKIILVLVTVLFVQNTFAQSSIQSQKDSLQAVLKQLKKEMSTLKSEIDSLKEDSMNMDSKIDNVRLEAYQAKYGKKIGRQVAAKQIWIGMTEEMMYDSWGKPDKVNKNVEKWGTFTQWYYGTVAYFFKDGKLTEWEEKK